VCGAALNVAAWVAPAAAQDPPPPAPPPPLLSAEQWAELDAYIAGAVVAFDVPGAAVALIQDGQIAYVGTYGVRGVDDPVAVTEDTRFMIGSVTKSMTTTLAAELVSQGRLGWDDAVSDHLPEFELSSPEWTPLVTLRDLFRHTSGVPRSDLWLFIERPQPRGLLETVSELPVLSAPGERFEYQNQLFALGGFAAMRAAGASLHGSALLRAYVRRLDRRLFEPLGMTRSTADFGVALSDDDHAWPHAIELDTALPGAVPIGVERFVEPIAPSGAVWTSVTDLARYFVMHLREGETADGVRVFSAAEITETHTPQTPVDEAGGAYALGWGAASSGIGDLIDHGGGTAGFRSQLLGLPAADWGVVVLSNRSGSPLVDRVIARLIEIGYGLPAQGDEAALAAEAEYRAQLQAFAATLLPVPAEAVAPFSGRYEHELVVGHRGSVLTLDTVYGELEFRRLPDVDLYICTSSHLIGLPAQFAVDEQGTPSVLLGLQIAEDGSIVDPIVSHRVEHGPPCRREPRRRHAGQSASLRALSALRARLQERQREF
jgi:CubicO group peptidase (beta-lactamase class C family)